MGWVKAAGVFRKKIRKYVYEDYWNMIFSSGEYVGTVHPDYASHFSFVPPSVPPNAPEDPWDLTVYGSMYDYYNEVSNHNLLINAYQTRSGGYDKYNTGIVNKIDAANGKNYVRWVMMPHPKTHYDAGWRDPIADAISRVDDLHYNTPTNDPDYLEFAIRSYPSNGKICVVTAGGELGGWAYLGGQYYVAAEKTFGFRNTSPGAVLDGIQVHVHEFGHTIGFTHYIAGSYEMMHWGGLGHRRHYWSPPHINPLLKLLTGWIPSGNVVRLIQDSWMSLGPINNSASLARVDIDGDNEYLLVEYRKREGFNRFAGGPYPQDPGFTGGALVWHFSAITRFPIGGQVVDTRVGLKVTGFGQSFMGNPGHPTHFYPYHGTPLDPLSTPNSNSVSGISTGISLRDFSFSGGYLNFYVGFGPLPLQNVSVSVHSSGGNSYPRLTWTPAPEPDVRKGGQVVVERRTKAITDYDWSPWGVLATVGGGSSDFIDYSITRACQGNCPDLVEYRLRAVDNMSNSSGYSAVVQITAYGIWYKQGISPSEDQPQRYELSASYPNPFNPTTKISYALPEEAFVSLRVFDLLGREVATIVNRSQKAGKYDVQFDARDLPSGVYLYKIQAGSFTDVKRMLLLK